MDVEGKYRYSLKKNLLSVECESLHYSIFYGATQAGSLHKLHMSIEKKLP